MYDTLQQDELEKVLRMNPQIDGDRVARFVAFRDAAERADKGMKPHYGVAPALGQLDQGALAANVSASQQNDPSLGGSSRIGPTKRDR